MMHDNTVNLEAMAEHILKEQKNAALSVISRMGRGSLLVLLKRKSSKASTERLRRKAEGLLHTNQITCDSVHNAEMVF